MSQYIDNDMNVEMCALWLQLSLDESKILHYFLRLEGIELEGTQLEVEVAFEFIFIGSLLALAVIFLLNPIVQQDQR